METLIKYLKPTFSLGLIESRVVIKLVCFRIIIIYLSALCIPNCKLLNTGILSNTDLDKLKRVYLQELLKLTVWFKRNT